MRLKTFLRIIVIIIILGLLIISSAYFVLNGTIKLPPIDPTILKTDLETNSALSKTEAIIISVGDVFIHQSVLDSVFDKEKNTYNFDNVFEPVEKYFNDADISTAWLGGVIDEKGPYSGYPSFKSPAQLAETLNKIGLGIAFRTNHTLDFGTKGFETTTKILEQNNINQIAAYTTEEASKNIFIYQKDNLKISFLGYIYGMNGIPIPKPWMINLIELEKIKTDIKKAKKTSDFVVVALHFGTEYERYPNKSQKSIAQEVADAGADMIIGSHPHVLQPVEKITSIDGREVFVAYGLGNFFCGQRQHYTDAGMILKYTVEKNEGKTRLKDIGYIPTWVAKYKENNKYQFKILPSKKYLKLYEEGLAKFLSLENYKHFQQTYQETLNHMNNPEIGFSEIE